MTENNEKEFTNVTFRVPTEDYVKYKIILLQLQSVGRKTPTSDLNFYIRSVINDAEHKEEK